MTDPVKMIVARIRKRYAPSAGLRLDRADSRQWQSLLFDGARHSIRIALPGEHVDLALAVVHELVDDRAFEIPGHVVADIRLAAIDRRDGEALLDIEALTVEARG